MKEIKTYAEGGKGRKQCGACGIYLPAVSKVCKCGNVFVRKVAPTPQEPEDIRGDLEKPEPPKTLHIRLIVINTPEGKCPVKLKETDFNSVSIWANGVMEAGYRIGRKYTLGAIKYFAREFYALGSPECKQVCENLILWEGK